jgi:ferric iron reductase protein FhuF
MNPDSTYRFEEDFTLLRSALDKVSEYLPYLKADITSSPATNFISCSALLDDPATLKKVVLESGIKIGTVDERVACSLFLLSYSYRLLAMGMAPLFIAGAMPASDPENMYFDITSGRVSKLCYLSAKSYQGSTQTQDLRAAIDNIIGGHLHTLTLCLKSEFAIGSRLLWGNIASAAASVFRTLEGLFGQDFIALGELFFTLVPDKMKNQGSFYLLSLDERHGWYWERKNCCLYYQLGKDKCNDCSLVPQPIRRKKYQEMLEGN